MFENRLTILGLLLLSCSSFAMEDDDLIALYDEEELISIATGTEKRLRFAPSVASVITSEDIQRSGYRTLSEALESVPGIHISDSVLFDDDLISVRGIHTSNNPQVLLLIDGVEVRHLFTAARPAGFRLPLQNVSRIEIIRGPGSAVYGADAFAGVINVITKSSDDIQTGSFGVRTGSFNTQDAWAQTAFSSDNVDVAFSVEYMKTEGDHNRIITNDGFGRSGKFRSEYEIFNSQLKLGIGDFEVRLHNWSLHDGGNGVGGAQVLDEIGSVEVDYYQLDLGYKTDLANDLVLDARVGYNQSDTDIENTLFPSGTPLCLDPAGCPPAAPVVFPDGVIGNPGADAEVYDADLALLYKGVPGHVMRWAVGYKKEDLDTNEVKNFGPGVVPTVLTDVSDTPDVFVEDIDRDVYYVSVQDEWAFANDWTLTLGLRYDDFSDVGDTFNPRLALVWAANYNLTAKLLYGRAFRAPSFTELFSQNNPAQIGNPNLEPEVIDTIEAALVYNATRDVDVNVNIFYYEVEDLIDFVPAASGLQAQNAIDQKGHGVELSTVWRISPELTADANMSWQSIEDKDSGDQVADIPTEQLYLNLFWKPVDNWDFNIEGYWIGDRTRASTDARLREVGSYTLVNFSGKKSFESGLGVGFLVKNIFDESGEEPSEDGAFLVNNDFPIEGRSAYIELSYSLDD